MPFVLRHAHAHRARHAGGKWRGEIIELECVLATPTKNCFGCWSLVLLFRLIANRVVSSVTVLVMTSETVLVGVANKTHSYIALWARSITPENEFGAPLYSRGHFLFWARARCVQLNVCGEKADFLRHFTSQTDQNSTTSTMITALMFIESSKPGKWFMCWCKIENLRGFLRRDCLGNTYTQIYYCQLMI